MPGTAGHRPGPAPSSLAPPTCASRLGSLHHDGLCALLVQRPRDGHGVRARWRRVRSPLGNPGTGPREECAMTQLIVCCDGTWNTLEDTDQGLPAPTNVAKLYNAV